MMNWNGEWTWGNWVAMSVMMVLFWAAVMWLVVWFARGRTSQSSASSAKPSRPEDVLAERFAHGEIDQVEYQERLRVLGGPSAGGRTSLHKSGMGR